MSDIKYSIIIPVYNLAGYIERTLESIKQNNLEYTEIIVIDDGSTDDSLQIIRSFFANNNQINSKIISQSNSGVSVARNRGIKEAKGEYLIFVDGDDICDADMVKIIDANYANYVDIRSDIDKNDYLSNVDERFSNTSLSDDEQKYVHSLLVDVIVWRFEITDLKEQTVANEISQEPFAKEIYGWKEFLDSLLRGQNRIRIGSFAIRKKVLMDHNIWFTPGCTICEDVEFIYKALLMSERIVTLNDILYTYIRREGSAINTYDMRRFEAPVAIRRIYDFVMDNRANEVGEYIEDSLRYGLMITHAMYSFDSCCRYIESRQKASKFIDKYYEEQSKVEQMIIDAFKHMRYKPTVYSKKRLWLFMFSRRIYTYCMYKR